MKKAGMLILILLLLTGCSKPEVNYNEVLGSPYAKIENNELIMKGGPSTVASTSYVVPHAEIKDNKIYIYGTLSFKKDIEKKVELSQKISKWTIYWVNKDGTLIEMNN